MDGVNEQDENGKISNLFDPDAEKTNIWTKVAKPAKSPGRKWHICYSVGAESAYKYMDMVWSSFHSSIGLIKFGADKTEKQKFQREEWFGHMLRFRNDAIIILSIICLQLPFELAYAHLYEIIGSDIIK
ncbi:hypothetical protein Hanom_Chr17g01552191 [Helianthus anomalus]